MTALEKKLEDGLARVDNELRESQKAAAAAANTQVGAPRVVHAKGQRTDRLCRDFYRCKAVGNAAVGFPWYASCRLKLKLGFYSRLLLVWIIILSR